MGIVACMQHSRGKRHYADLRQLVACDVRDISRLDVTSSLQAVHGSASLFRRTVQLSKAGPSQKRWTLENLSKITKPLGEME